MAIVNSVNAAGLPDLILTLITLSFFVVGSIGGLFKIFHLAGQLALSIVAGMSFGMRLVLMREGLLFRPTTLNWIIIVVCAVAGFALTWLRQRMGIVRAIFFNVPHRQHLKESVTGHLLHAYWNVPPLARP